MHLPLQQNSWTTSYTTQTKKQPTPNPQVIYPISQSMSKSDKENIQNNCIRSFTFSE